MGRGDFSRELDRALTEGGDSAVETLAARLEVTSTSVNRWRRGTEQPSRSRWSAIETALGWPPGTVYELLARAEKMGRADGTLETLVSAIERNTAALERNTRALEESS